MSALELPIELAPVEVKFQLKPSINRYPSTGPNGESWEEYFAVYRENLLAKKAAASAEPGDEDDEVEAAITVTIPAHEVTEGWPKALSTWRKDALAAGWEVKMGHCAYHVADVWLKDGSAIRYPAKDEAHWWMNAVKGNRYATVTYTTKADGKTKEISRIMNGEFRLLSGAEMKEKLNAD